jgi:translation elongation factor EF-Tu-like GTPase
MGLFRRKTEVIDTASLMSEVSTAAISGDLRLTVQDVLHPGSRHRGDRAGRVGFDLGRGGGAADPHRRPGVRTVRVSGIEMFRKVKEQAAAVENVSLLLDGIGDDDIVKGDVLIAKGASTSLQGAS